MFKVLIIEDEESIAELERDYLEISSYEVTICNDGEKGLKEALDNEYDLYILDLMLPGVDGFEICKAIRSKKNTPIIMVSAKKDDIDKCKECELRYMCQDCRAYIKDKENIYSAPTKCNYVL